VEAEENVKKPKKANEIVQFIGKESYRRGDSPRRRARSSSVLVRRRRRRRS
jgi:hypothetical protein